MINPPSQQQLDKMPSLYETENIPLEEKLVYFHFTIDKSHWWAMEWNRNDTFFGYVLLNGWLQDAELGYFSLSELQSINLGRWLEVQNDPTWIIRPVKDVSLIRETLNFKSAIYPQLVCKTG